MRKFKRRPQTVFAFRFSEKGLKENFEKSNLMVKKGKGYHITASASYCPTTDDYRGQNFRLHAPLFTEPKAIYPGEWIVRDERGNFTVLSDEAFQATYKPAK